MSLVRTLGLILALHLAAAAVAGGENEYRLKAAFLVQFAKYVEWPSSAFDRPSSPLVIGVLGSDPFGKAIDDAASAEKVDGRDIVVRRLRLGQDLRQCHVLFVSREDAARAASDVSNLAGPVLTVGESADFARKIGIVNFFIENRKVRFEINPDRGRGVGLAISSRLLSLARIVRGGG